MLLWSKLSILRFCICKNYPLGDQWELFILWSKHIPSISNKVDIHNIMLFSIIYIFCSKVHYVPIILVSILMEGLKVRSICSSNFYGSKIKYSWCLFNLLCLTWTTEIKRYNLELLIKQVSCTSLWLIVTLFFLNYLR